MDYEEQDDFNHSRRYFCQTQPVFIPVMIRNLKPREISSMSIKKSGSTGQENNKIEHYEIVANYNRGNSIPWLKTLKVRTSPTRSRSICDSELNTGNNLAMIGPLPIFMQSARIEFPPFSDWC